MKTSLKIAIWIFVGIFCISSLGLFCLFQTNVWKTILTSQITKQAYSRYGLVVKIGKIDGNVLKHLHATDITLSTRANYKLGTVSNLTLDYHLMSVFGKKPIIEAFIVDTVLFGYPGTIDTLALLFGKPSQKSSSQIDLKHVRITNLIVTNSRNPGKRLLSEGLIDGSLQVSSDSVRLIADSVHAVLETIQEEIAISDAHILKVSNSLFVQGCRLKSKSTTGNVIGKISLKSPFSGEFAVQMDNVVLSERLKNVEKVFSEGDFICLNGNVTILNDEIGTDIQFQGKLRGREVTDGLLIGEIHDRKFNVKTLSFMSGDETIYGLANGDFDSGITANLEVSNFDLLYWGIIQKKTLLNGSANLIVEGKMKTPDRFIADVDFTGSAFDTLGFDKMKGRVIYRNGLFTIPDTMLVVQGQTSYRLTGEGDLKANTIDARVYVNSSQVGPLAKQYGITGLMGSAEAFLEATGDLKNPDFRGWVNGKKFGIPALNFEEAIARFGLVNIGDRHFGDIFIEATNGKSDLIKDPMPFAALILRFEGDTAFIRSMRLVGEDLSLEAQGNIVKGNEINLKNFRASRYGNDLISLTPISFLLNQDTIRFQDVDFSLNDGRLKMSAEAVNKKVRSAKFKFTNLSIDPVNALLKGSRGVEGILDGVVEYSDFPGSPEHKANVNIRNANLFGQKYKNIRIDAILAENQVRVDTISIIDLHDGNLMGSGSFSCNFPMKNGSPFVTASDSLRFQFEASDFVLKTFDPVFWTNLRKDGKISGKIEVKNRMDSPVIDYDLTVANPVFDKMHGNELAVKGKYQNSRFNFSDLMLKDDAGTTKGKGFLPFTIRFVPPVFSYNVDSSLSLNISQHSNSLNFITDYFEDVENLTGDFDIALSFSGTPNHPVRSGNVTVKNGVLKMSMLENPITRIEGSALMSKNVLDIVSMDAHMFKPAPRNKLDQAKSKLKSMTLDVLFPPQVTDLEPNLIISGNIDFTRFFRPVYNIKTVGNRLYIRTLLAEQEGIIDGEFSISGRDTINIEGDVDVTDFIIRNEFKVSEPVIEKVKPSSTYTNINIHTIIPGNLYFRNNQLDADLSGEMWIIRNGADPFQFSGTLDVRSGKFFYYGWEFNIVRGSIIFDPTEFNPTLDFEAQVDLASYTNTDSTGSISSDDNEYATVYLTGDLEQPLLEFESSNYSQSDILMFLTRTGSTSEENGSQDRLSSDALNVFGMYFERQLEKSISRLSGLDEFELRTKGNLFSNQSTDQWSVMLGQKLAPNLFVTYERNFSLIEPNQQFGLEYRINRYTSLVGEVDQNGLLRINYQYKYHY